MRITIVGGGNIGTQFAVHCAETGHEVTVYTSAPDLYNGHLDIVDDEGKVTHEGIIKIATADPEKAFRSAELILITLPATLMDVIAGVIYVHSGKDVIIGVAPGNGGSECAFKKCIERGNTFFALERVPAIARLIQKGRTVKSTGYREELRIAAMPEKDKDRCSEIVSGIFRMPCRTVHCMLNLTMTPSNPILHTSRLYRLFKDWREGDVFDSLPLFYEEWDDVSSELLLAMDDEEQRICLALPEFHLTDVKPLREHYGSPTVTAMTKKICSIRAFKGLATPALKVEGGIVPDLHSRYFTADFSFGLNIIQQVGRISGVDTPLVNKVMYWYRGIAVEKKEFRFEDYGIIDRDSMREFYLR